MHVRVKSIRDTNRDERRGRCSQPHHIKHRLNVSMDKGKIPDDEIRYILNMNAVFRQERTAGGPAASERLSGLPEMVQSAVEDYRKPRCSLYECRFHRWTIPFVVSCTNNRR